MGIQENPRNIRRIYEHNKSRDIRIFYRVARHFNIYSEMSLGTITGSG